MKNYDHNLDGYISLEDFEKISANFPFSFCTHETDRHGQISREEITSYFMRGMSVCAKLGFNFNDVHNFQETTYKQTTFCKGCGGCLLGVKQGFQCKDCGMNCHKHCRALVGMECLRKQKMPPSSCLCTPDAKNRGNSCSSEEVAFVFPPTGDTEPMRKSSDPMRKSSDPMRKSSDPLRKSSDPMRKSSDPLTMSSEPMRKRSEPMRKGSDPLRKGSDPLRKSSSPLRKGSGILRKSSDPMALSNRYTQTEPGTWTPERGNKRIERNHAQEKLQSNSLPSRTREGSVPVSFLQEKMEELHLYKERNREPD
ncbi:RAS guanyl-releasing protein 4 isoform X2 [Gadus macrocephalus]|uniref:RAS guanyl-releasing protein 4 isoform X2 n=1 Tax=Gadus macrocephalus TaxID=80720 RepID=UPI0028CB2126|nr:RAS guanyl-releasing protein 4 isoform X2 [Gadus macrocephalus]